MNATPLDPNRWKALGVVGAASLVTILDVSIVNVALPTIGVKLHFSQANLQWVITAYAITYGGFLLLGGRAADLLGRRAVFMAGVVLFTAASFACGLAGSDTFLIAMRAVQGVGGAIVAPAALSIVSTAFPQGAERNKALGVWGALAGSGAAIGVILGGVLTKYVGWQAIFFVNIPVGIAVLVLAPIVIRESKLEVARRRYDPLGALAITGSIVLLVYSISKAPSVGWGTGRTIGGLAASVVLFALFLFLESRVAEPLMPLSIWRLRTVTTGNVVGAVCGSVMFSTFFLLTLYMQDVLGYSALQTGMGILCTAIASIAFAIVAEALVTRLGPKVVLGTGLALMGAALVWFAQFPVHGRYWVDLFGPFVVLGIGAGFSFVPVSIIALAGVPGREQGLASGLMNTSQQVGGAVGLAVAATIFTTRFSHELPHLLSQGVGAAEAAPRALVSGFTLAYWVLAIIAFAGCAATILLLRGVELVDESATEPVVDTHVVSPFCFNRAATSAISTMVLGDAVPEKPTSIPT